MPGCGPGRSFSRNYVVERGKCGSNLDGTKDATLRKDSRTTERAHQANLGSQIKLVALTLGRSAGDSLKRLRGALEKLIDVCAGDVVNILRVAEAVGDLKFPVCVCHTRSLLGRKKRTNESVVRRRLEFFARHREHFYEKYDVTLDHWRSVTFRT